ncbi:DUF7344 domain-containing protein [Haloarcula sp. NS06]|uniref:DUF7344 domain-containing protein n=1 Tax=Haloarcula sp. NS06 TaxID=3409688 RepID=UPI003DA7752C
MPDISKLDDFISSLYHALRAARRRYAIQFLKEADNQRLTTRELARKIAAVELGVPERQATGEPYRNAYNALSQTHLPTLSDAGIIIYDSQRQVIRPAVNFDLAALLIDTNTPTVHVFSALIEQSNESKE